LISLKLKSLAQATGVSRSSEKLSLKRDWKHRPLWVLAQASPSRSSERPSLRRALETKGGELLPFSLRRELLA